MQLAVWLILNSNIMLDLEISYFNVMCFVELSFVHNDIKAVSSKS